MDVGGTARIGKNLRDDLGHRPCVAEAQAGLALTYHGVRFTCTQVLRTPKFYDQNRYTQFGSINVTFRY
jgi:lipid A 3-O-deacylase